MQILRVVDKVKKRLREHFKDLLAFEVPEEDFLAGIDNPLITVLREII
jgi:hypothetical protein